MKKTQTRTETTPSEQNLYVENLRIWLRQLEYRLAFCDEAIASSKTDIRSHKKQIPLLEGAIHLERDQKKVMRCRIAIGKRRLNAALRAQKSKP